MYGNTARVAAAIAEAIDPDVPAVEVGSAPHDLPPDLELLVVGGPTHGHGMSQPQSRASAADRAERPIESRGDGVREWVTSLRIDHPVGFVAFDTRIKGPKLLWGSASEPLAKALAERGLRQAAAPISFIVGGPTGSPYDRLVPGELERARELGRQLARLLLERSR
jgi:hypothetical protein